MYPCNYKTSFWDFFKRPLFVLPVFKKSPIKLYMDKLITISEYKNLLKNNNVGATYYYPISIVFKVNSRIFSNYINKNQKKFILYGFVILLLIGSITCR